MKTDLSLINESRLARQLILRLSFQCFSSSKCDALCLICDSAFCVPCSHTESEYYAPSKSPPRVHPMSGLRATVPQRCLRRSFLQCCPVFRPNARRTASRLHGNASIPLDGTRSKRTARTRPASRGINRIFSLVGGKRSALPTVWRVYP